MKSPNMSVPLTLLAVMLCWTSLSCSEVYGQQTTENDGQADAFGKRLVELESSLGQRIEKLEADNTALKMDNDVLHQHVKRLDAENAMMKQHLTIADTMHDEAPVQVAFSVASSETFGPVTVDTTVPYEITYTNVGGAWFPVVHYFLAPVNGIYYFSASIGSDDSGGDAYADIVLTSAGTETKVANLFGRSQRTHDAIAVILELEEEDLVSVQLRSGNGVLHSTSSDVITVFTGFLLFQ